MTSTDNVAGERSELLRMFDDDSKGSPGRGGNDSAGSNSDSDDGNLPNACHCDQQKVISFLTDLSLSVLFWGGLNYMPIPDEDFFAYGIPIAIILFMVVWRLYRAYGVPLDEGGKDLPYTVAYLSKDNKEVFLVATLHISPRAPRDVETVINSVNPDVAMIELDDERLDRMRDPEPEVENPQPKLKDLQPIKITAPGEEPITLTAQRAVWNAEWAGEVTVGDVIYDEENAFALKAQEGMHNSIALVKRGAPNKEYLPFALKAHNAAKGGASALFVMSGDNRLPVDRLGSGGSVANDLKVAWNTRSCGFPPVPVFLLRQSDGDRLQRLCQQQNRHSPVKAEFRILPDHYPRRTLRLRLCQACSLLCSGIGVLYGIIECFAVEVGAEFTVAEQCAKALGIPCACIDVNLNKFWARLGAALCPTPCNIFNSFWCWLCLPRVLFQVLFPPRSNVDVVGSMVLHAASFPLRTWVAFIFAGFCASHITSGMLSLLGYGASKAAEKTGAVSGKDREALQDLIMLVVQMYALPQVYSSIAASRDEAMYRSIVKKSRMLGTKRMVVVVGAAHSNGILARARERGL